MEKEDTQGGIEKRKAFVLEGQSCKRCRGSLLKGGAAALDR